MTLTLIVLLTVVLVVTCLALILLVLIQLPKKDAGLGLAFGGSTADALFGAGSGNVLTKATKYAAATFFIVSVILGLLQSSYHDRGAKDFQKAVDAQAAAPATMPMATTPATPTAATPATTTATTPAPAPAEASSAQPATESPAATAPPAAEPETAQ